LDAPVSVLINSLGVLAPAREWLTETFNKPRRRFGVIVLSH
jgi:hypothetical protein